MARILCAGVAVMDFIFQVDEMPVRAEKYRARDAAIAGGGCAANAAVAIARQGGRALLATRLGSDPVGDMIIADLENEQVDTAFVNRSPGGKSSFSSVYVDSGGERQIMNFVGSGLAGDAGWIGEVTPLDAVLADNRWPPLTRRALAIARQHNVPGIVDGEASVDASALDGASHVAFSVQGLRTHAGATDFKNALKEVADKIGAWVCVTDGARGVYYLDGGHFSHIPAFPITAVDTLGAGDIWHGAFALRLAEGAPEPEAIRFANAAAALKCLQFGGRKGCPDRAAVNSFLMENG